MHSSDDPPELQPGCFVPVLALLAAGGWVAWSLARALWRAVTDS